MATSAQIGYIENGQVHTVYSHANNELDCNGMVLHHLYPQPAEWLKRLIDKKLTISSLGSSSETTIYARNNDDLIFQFENTKECEERCYGGMLEYLYLFDVDNNEWIYKKLTGKTKLKPVSKRATLNETKEHSRILDEYNIKRMERVLQNSDSFQMGLDNERQKN